MPLTRTRPPAAVDPDSDDKPWIDFKALMNEPCALVVFRFIGEDPPLESGARKARADVLIVSRDGKTVVNELHRDESILGNGITNKLLGIPDGPKQRPGLEPGTEWPARIDKGKNPHGGAAYPQANDPDDDQFKLIESAYRERWWESNGSPVADASDAPF